MTDDEKTLRVIAATLSSIDEKLDAILRALTDGEAVTGTRFGLLPLVTGIADEVGGIAMDTAKLTRK